MPLYEYQCESCEHRFERIQKFSDPPPDACPKCGGAVKKLFSSPAIQFKGTGWYITDYAKKSSSGEAKTDSGKDSSGGSESSGGATPGKESKESQESKGSKESKASKESKDSTPSSSKTKNE